MIIDKFILAARLGLGLLLAITGFLKVGHAADLASAIAGFRLLSPGIVAPLALIVPVVEIMLGLYLVAGLLTRIAAWVTAALFFLYALAIASAVLRHIPANCGCFGPNDRAVADWPHVAFDIGLTVVAVWIAVRAPGALALDRRLRRS